MARLARLSQFLLLMGDEISIAELQRAGIGIRAGEAIAIVQKLINGQPCARPQPPFAPPSPKNVLLDEEGNVACQGCDVKPAVSEIGVLLEAMLPPGTRLAGALQYTIARALLNVDAPPFDSIEELSSALARFERHDRDHVLRELVTRARAAADGDAHAAIIPFKHSPASGRVKGERRRPMPAVLAADLRRELRRADLENYAHRAASTIPDLRVALAGHKRSIGTIAAGLTAGLLLIASGEVMRVDGAAAENDTLLPPVTSPPPRIPEPADAYRPPSDPFDRLPAATSAHAVSRRASYALVNSRGRPNGRSHKLRADRPVPAARRSSGTGVLDRFRLGWMRNLFTYKRDL